MSSTTQTADAATATVETTTSGAPRLGPWRLERSLGRGGQGATWLGRHVESGQVAAVKRFRVAEIAEWKRLELFEREAATLAALSHPAIPRFLGTGADADGTERWIAMELIEGEALSARLGRPSSSEELARLFTEALDVLAYLHGRAPPVLHRDLKPHNLIVRPDGRLAVVDFGSVRTALAPTGSSTVVGTFGYLAPEQLHGAASPASDLYSLGVAMIALATGIDGALLPRRGLKIDVDGILKDYPDPAMRAVWAALCEPDPDERPKDVAAVRALIASAEPSPGPAPEPVVELDESTPFPPAEPWRPRGPLGEIVRVFMAIALQLTLWVLSLVARLVMPRVHAGIKRRIARQHDKNAARRQAELALEDKRHALRQLKLQQTRGKVAGWHRRMDRGRRRSR